MITRRRMLELGLLAPAGMIAARADASQPITAAVYDLSRYRLSLHWKDEAGVPYRTLQAVTDTIVRRGGRVAAVTNAGIYETDHTPLGLHIEEGRALRPLNRDDGEGNFFLKPNGVFSIAGDVAGISEASAFRMSDDMSLATQSGPLLVLDGVIHPAFRRQSTSRRTRNAVGVREDGAVVLALSRRPVTLWDMAVYMRDAMGCPSALYLDGVISQLWLDGDPPPETRYPYVGILAVTERSPV